MITSTQLLRIIVGTIGTFAFSITFNIRNKRLLFSTIGGFLSCVCFEFGSLLFNNEAFCCFIASTITSLYSEILARVLKTPTTTFFIPSLLPLIPGGSLYNTMAYAISQDSQRFKIHFVNTIWIAAALALGIVLTSAVFQLIVSQYNVFSKKINKNE